MIFYTIPQFLAEIAVEQQSEAQQQKSNYYHPESRSAALILAHDHQYTARYKKYQHQENQRKHQTHSRD